MTKREKMLLAYKLIFGDVSADDCKDILTPKQIEECKNRRRLIGSIMTIDLKESLITIMDIALKLTEKEKGENFTNEDLQKNVTALTLMVDPDNKISPLAFNDIDKN